MNPNWRSLAGMFLILLLILVWSVAVVSLYDPLIADTPWPVQALYFVVAGTAWVLPLRPLIRWMGSS